LGDKFQYFNISLAREVFATSLGSFSLESGWRRRNGLVRLAAIHLLVSAAKRAKPLEGLDYQEEEAGLLASGALAHDAVHAALSQGSGSFGYGFVAHAARVFNGGARWSSADQL